MKIVYKIGKGEKIVVTYLKDGKPSFITTRCQDCITYIIYSVDSKGITNKLYKGNNPLVLEEKAKVFK